MQGGDPSGLGAAAAFGSSAAWAYASARYALAAREVSPVRVNLVRMLIAWPVFIAIGLAQGTLGRGLSAHHLSWLALSTLCSYAIGDNLFFAAARRLGVSSALAIASTYPLWSALKGTIVDGEGFGWARAMGTLLCVSGVAAVIKLGQRPSAQAGEPITDRWGVPLALVTSMLWAGNTIAVKTGSVGLSLATVNGLRYAIAIMVLSGLLAAGRAPGAARPARGWWPMLPAIAIDCLIGSTLFVYGLGHTDLAVGATLTSMAPLLSLPIAVWLGVEKLSPAKLAAVVTTVVGIALLATS